MKSPAKLNKIYMYLYMYIRLGFDADNDFNFLYQSFYLVFMILLNSTAQTAHH